MSKRYGLWAAALVLVLPTFHKAPVVAKDGGVSQPLAKPAASVKTLPVCGKVIDESQKPVAGAEIWLPVHTTDWPVLHATADSHGRFALEVPSASVDKERAWTQWPMLWAFVAGHQIGSTRVMLSPAGASDVVLRIEPESDTSFVVLDPKGRPCSGALVEPYRVEIPMPHHWPARECLPEELRTRVGAPIPLK